MICVADGLNIGLYPSPICQNDAVLNYIFHRTDIQNFPYYTPILSNYQIQTGQRLGQKQLTKKEIGISDLVTEFFFLLINV